MDEIGIAILGFGTVGEATFHHIESYNSRASQKGKLRLNVIGAGIRDIHKSRKSGSIKLTADLRSLIENPGVEIVIETMGGIGSAYDLVKLALSMRKAVVTANKELIATYGNELLHLAAENHVPLLFEASVGGGIPIIRSLRVSLCGDEVERIFGILNGTTNFILAKMSRQGLDYQDALALAQKAGFAEVNPSNDVEGIDTSYKMAILGWLAYGSTFKIDQFHRRGITELISSDFELAALLGFEIKLLGLFEKRKKNVFACRVGPALIPSAHPFAKVINEFNAVQIDGKFSGSLTFIGKGAGGNPTANSILGDVLAIVNGCTAQRGITGASTSPGEVKLLDHWNDVFYIRGSYTPGSRPEILKWLEDRGIRAVRIEGGKNNKVGILTSKVSVHLIEGAVLEFNDKIVNATGSENVIALPVSYPDC